MFQNNCCFWDNKWNGVSRNVFKTRRSDHGCHERQRSQRELIQHNFECYLVMKQVLVASKEVPPLP